MTYCVKSQYSTLGFRNNENNLLYQVGIERVTITITVRHIIQFALVLEIKATIYQIFSTYKVQKSKISYNPRTKKAVKPEML